MDAYAQSPPGPWDIPAQAPSFFMDSKQTIKVPYTSSMKVKHITHALRRKMLSQMLLQTFPDDTFYTQGCHVCVGMGRKPCKDCAGAGNVSHLHIFLFM